ncbi:MAG TPA: quinone-dependent dihydroorotate dehydrogenase [Pyrinomonadaceae bacterium]|nr:quinone-dependent dihydroorotate dehydrogenase [Pyrinomonadaceae bacterium]
MSLYSSLAQPLLFRTDAEKAHEFGMSILRRGLASPFYVDDASFGMPPIELFGLKFANPLGIAAGFDKNGVVVDQLASLGFGFVEVGTVTLEPQPGNPKPRMFRLPDDQALINRLGFNNNGADALVESIRGIEHRCVVGINIGKNKDVPNDEAVENFVSVLEKVHCVADYVTVNVSSPNTPGLRDLQNTRELSELVGALSRKNVELGEKPLLVKIAPDLANDDIDEITDVCISAGCSGIIATNTTISREGISSPLAGEAGGLSGRPLWKRSNEVISQIYKRAAGRLAVIGVGGIFIAEDAFEKIASGASLVQAYTGFVYGGPTFAADVNQGLVRLLNARGFSSVSEAVGSGV